MILGGLKIGVSPLDMAHAYETFAEGGRRVYDPVLGAPDKGPTGIAQIYCPKVCPQQGRGRSTRVRARAPGFDRRSRSTRCSTGVVQSGTGTSAAISGVDVAGKTGTTTNYADAWFVGWTPQLTTAVWVGFPNKLVPMTTDYNGAPVEGGTYPAIIWHNFMVQALQILATENRQPEDHDRRRRLTRPARRRSSALRLSGTGDRHDARPRPRRATGGADRRDHRWRRRRRTGGGATGGTGRRSRRWRRGRHDRRRRRRRRAAVAAAPVAGPAAGRRPAPAAEPAVAAPAARRAAAGPASRWRRHSAAGSGSSATLCDSAGRDRNRLSSAEKRHGNSAAFVIPIRLLAADLDVSPRARPAGDHDRAADQIGAVQLEPDPQRLR